MELKDYYAIMGVKPTDDLKTIKTAYRRLARKYHPDVSKETDAEARFKEIAEAWEVLSDEQRRAEYDQLWQHRNDPQFNRQFQQGENPRYNAEDFDDIFPPFLVSKRGIRVSVTPAAAMISKSTLRSFLKKRWRNITAPSAITCRYITRLAW